eukprot:scaffold5850_cov110-Cylindrotheca_fusiformis.AAC.1
MGNSDKLFMIALLILCHFYLDFVKLFNHLEQAKEYTTKLVDEYGISTNYTIGSLYNYTSEWAAGIANYTSEFTAKATISDYISGQVSIPPGPDLGLSNHPNPLIYFIHVGKAGGTTMYKALNDMVDSQHELEEKLQERKNLLHCYMDQFEARQDDGNDDDDDDNVFCQEGTRAQTKLGSLVLGRVHRGGEKYTLDEKAWMRDHADLFLFSVRDPISRMISTFQSHQKEQTPFYTKCSFQDGSSTGLEQFLEFIVNYDGNDKVKLDCQRRGILALKGRETTTREGGRLTMGYNFVWGYRQYWKSIGMEDHPERKIAVIRTEHLWEDMARLDIAVGGDGRTFLQRGQRVELVVKPEEYNRVLSPTNTHILCCLIHDDLKTYQTLILKAANLDDDEKLDTIGSLYTQCGAAPKGFSLASAASFSWDTYYHSNTCAALLKK